MLKICNLKMHREEEVESQNTNAKTTQELDAALESMSDSTKLSNLIKFHRAEHQEMLKQTEKLTSINGILVTLMIFVIIAVVFTACNAILSF